MYLVFEYVDRNLLEVLEENPNGIDVTYNYLARINQIYNLLAHIRNKLLPSNGYNSQGHKT